MVKDSVLAVQRAWVQFLVRELRSNMQHGQKKKKNKKQNYTLEIVELLQRGQGMTVWCLVKKSVTEDHILYDFIS